MLKNERTMQIENLLREEGFCTVKELAERLFASESSIRRDLADLQREGKVKRSYGGAELVTVNKIVQSFSTRAHDNIEEKQIIAKKAAELVGEGSIVFIDSSSTGYFLAAELMERADLTVVTNSIEILALLSKGKPTVHSTGGIMSGKNRICLIGRNAEAAFEEVVADLAFFSSKALATDGVITDCTQEEVFMRRAMFKNAHKKVALFTKDKIGKASSFCQCSLKDVDILVTDDPSAAEMFASYCEVL